MVVTVANYERLQGLVHAWLLQSIGFFSHPTHCDANSILTLHRGHILPPSLNMLLVTFKFLSGFLCFPVFVFYLEFGS